MTGLPDRTRTAGALLLLVAGALAVAGLACIAGSAADVAAQPVGTPPAGMPPGGAAPNGTPPDGMNGTAPPGRGMLDDSAGGAGRNLSGAYTVDGITATEAGKTYESGADDVSAVYVTNGGSLTLEDPTIVTGGETSSNDASSFYGQNAAVLASNGTVSITGGTISTTGAGANGAFPYGADSSISLTNVTITATGGGGHGVMASGGGSLTLVDTDIATSGANSAPIATDRGGGTVTVTGGKVVSSGQDSPGIYSTGVITVDGADITATGAEAAVIEGANSITLTDTDLVGSRGTRDRGIMVYQSMSGDADVGLGAFSMTGGRYDWTSTTGPAFYVTNTNATITLSGVTVTNAAAELLNASAGSWGTVGSNGGSVVFTADDEALAGSIAADASSEITAVLRNGTTLSGAIENAALSLDSSSRWTVTGDSALTTLADAAGISGTTITNIVGNGHTVSYDASLAGNSALGGRTFSLANGGTLEPATGTDTGAAPASSADTTGGSDAYTGATAVVTLPTATATANEGSIVTATQSASSGSAGSTSLPGTAQIASATTTAAAGTTAAGSGALPIVVGALAVGAFVLAERRR